MDKNLSKWSTYVIDGNHDFGEVLNSQDFTRPDSTLEYQSETWKHFFSSEAMEDFAKYGYYQMNLKTSKGKTYENVRIIGLNT